jgi:hypothetical protein
LNGYAMKNIHGSRSSCLLGGLIVAFVLAGCGESGGPAPGPASPNSQIPDPTLRVGEPPKQMPGQPDHKPK